MLVTYAPREGLFGRGRRERPEPRARLARERAEHAVDRDGIQAFEPRPESKLRGMRALGWIAMGVALACWGLRLTGLGLPLGSLVYLPMGLVTAAVYWLDKSRARRVGEGSTGLRRVPERTLHWLELAGGWAGALWAQELLRHKTRDRSFRRWFWAIGLAHLAAWSAYLGLRG